MTASEAIYRGASQCLRGAASYEPITPEQFDITASEMYPNVWLRGFAKWDRIDAFRLEGIDERLGWKVAA